MPVTTPSKRLKHRLMNRFDKLRHASPLTIYGYPKPPGAKSYDEIVKDLTADIRQSLTVIK
jgi:site-specific DNA recombinase